MIYSLPTEPVQPLGFNTPDPYYNDPKYFLEVKLKKGPVFIELLRGDRYTFSIKEPYDNIRTSYACNQFVAENKTLVYSKKPKNALDKEGYHSVSD